MKMGFDFENAVLALTVLHYSAATWVFSLRIMLAVSSYYFLSGIRESFNKAHV